MLFFVLFGVQVYAWQACKLNFAPIFHALPIHVKYSHKNNRICRNKPPRSISVLYLSALFLKYYFVVLNCWKSYGIGKDWCRVLLIDYITIAYRRAKQNSRRRLCHLLIVYSWSTRSYGCRHGGWNGMRRRAVYEKIWKGK